MTKVHTRREREKIRRRLEIMATALVLFSEKGYRNVSMREIASNAEIAIGTLYKFFLNKEDLYKCLLIELSDRFNAALSKAIESPGDEIVKLRRYVQAKGELFCNNAVTTRFYFTETRGTSFNIIARLDQDIHKCRERILEPVAEIFKSGIRTGRLHPIAEPYILSVALESLSNAFLFLWLKNPVTHSYPEDPDIILNIIFKGLVES